MTKEEKELTITYLTKMQEEYIEGEGYERHPLPEYYALDMAIKALEQQSCEDCVSRAEAIKELKESAEHHANDTREEVLLRRDRDIIRALPPVTPTFPKGATNGDIIKAMFPSVEVKEKNNGYEVYFGIGTSAQYFNHQWWNALYKRGNENGSN